MNKVVVVTGAARGIGLAIARRLLAEGYRAALLDIDAATLMRAAGAFGEKERVLALECDVADPSQVKASIDEVATRFGRIDALVNNAGIALFKPILETTYAEWARVLDVNLSGPFLCTQACAPVMLKNGGGAIVNISSISPPSRDCAPAACASPTAPARRRWTISPSNRRPSLETSVSA